MKLSCAWKCSGATNVGNCSSPTPNSPPSPTTNPKHPSLFNITRLFDTVSYARARRLPYVGVALRGRSWAPSGNLMTMSAETVLRSEEHTSELQSLRHLVCRLL